MPLQRPAQLAIPCLNPHSPLYQGLVFAGLGPHPGNWDYHDCSVNRSHARLTNMDPSTDWVFSQVLGRWTVELLASASQLITSPFTNTTTPATFACWFNVPAVNVYQRLLFANGATYPGGGIQVTSGKKLSVTARSSGGDVVRLGATDIVINTWYHGVGTIDRTANEWHVYVNGKLDDGTFTDNAGALVSATTLDIGRVMYAGSPYYGTESVADPLVFNRVLSQSEISALADPTNAMLAVGNVPLILPPHRVLFPAAVAPATGNRRRRLLICGKVA